LIFRFSQNIRINLNTPLKSVEQKDNENVHRTIGEDRKMLIQAAIVRIMKARQTLKHAFLMQEVIQQLSPRFKPQVPHIKVNKILKKNTIKSVLFFFRNVLIS
jgi:cullin 1